MSQNLTLTNTYLVDVCNFPSIRFGRYYYGRLPTNTVSGATITHPDGDITYTVLAGTAVDTGYTQSVTDTGETITNLLVDGLISVSADAAATWTTTTVGTSAKSIARSGPSITVSPTLATTITHKTDVAGSGLRTVVTSNFGGIASDTQVTTAGSGHKGPVTITGKSCGPS